MTRFALTTLLLLAVTGATSAGQQCYLADAESGRLEFAGAVEGTGFTGQFGEFRVRYCFAGEPAAGRIEVNVATASADTRNRERDEALLGEDFFHAEAYPEAVWVSRGIERAAGGYLADGELTLRGITREQAVEFSLEPDGEAIRARGRFRMSGEAEVDRQRFAVGRGEFADPEFVRNRVEVRFELELTRAGE